MSKTNQPTDTGDHFSISSSGNHHFEGGIIVISELLQQLSRIDHSIFDENH
jgi:hypothetical protein